MKIEAKIAAGSFGTVYRGTWKRHAVAIKEFKIDLDDADNQQLQQFIKEFENEVALLSRLRHKNILNFMGACLKPPRFAIVTEFS